MKNSERNLAAIRARVEAAGKQGDRELLVELLVQEEEYQSVYETHRATYDTAMAEVARIREDYRIFESEMNSRLNELRTLKSQAKMASLRENINSVNARYTSANSRIGSVNQNMDRARDLVNKKTARANAVESLNDNNLELKLKRLDVNTARERAKARAEAMLSGTGAFEVREKVVKAAIFRPLNLLWLIIIFGFASGLTMSFSELSWVPFAAFPAGFTFYILILGITLGNKEFHESFNRRNKQKNIRFQNKLCSKFAAEAKKYANNTFLQKLIKVINDKDSIISSYYDSSGVIEEKVAEQALNLTVSYLKLFINFCRRMREWSRFDREPIIRRINENRRKHEFTRNPHIKEDILRVIQTDEKLLNHFSRESSELKRLEMKLEYIEGTINMLRQHMIADFETTDMLEKLETAVNEASAFEAALDETGRRKMKI
jgi:phage shock protein A